MISGVLGVRGATGRCQRAQAAPLQLLGLLLLLLPLEHCRQLSVFIKKAAGQVCQGSVVCILQERSCFLLGKKPPSGAAVQRGSFTGGLSSGCLEPGISLFL